MTLGAGDRDRGSRLPLTLRPAPGLPDMLQPVLLSCSGRARSGPYVTLGSETKTNFKKRHYGHREAKDDALAQAIPLLTTDYSHHRPPFPPNFLPVGSPLACNRDTRDALATRPRTGPHILPTRRGLAVRALLQAGPRGTASSSFRVCPRGTCIPARRRAPSSLRSSRWALPPALPSARKRLPLASFRGCERVGTAGSHVLVPRRMNSKRPAGPTASALSPRSPAPSFIGCCVSCRTEALGLSVSPSAVSSDSRGGYSLPWAFWESPASGCHPPPSQGDSPGGRPGRERGQRSDPSP